MYTPKHWKEWLDGHPTLGAIAGLISALAAVGGFLALLGLLVTSTRTAMGVLHLGQWIALGVMLLSLVVLGAILSARSSWPASWYRRLDLSAAVKDLGDAYPDEFHSSILIGLDAEEHGFATLFVRNTWENDLDRVVARCFLLSDRSELPCFWSARPGRRFVSGDSYAADLPVDHERLLVVAQVFGKERLWARLPQDRAYLFHPPISRERAVAHKSGLARKTSLAGEPLDLGGEVLLEVTFKAQGLKQTTRVRLSFDADGPVVACS